MLQQNLRRRILSALVGIPIVIGAIYWNPWTYFWLFFCIMLLTLLEFYSLVDQLEVASFKIWGALCAAIMYALVFLYCQSKIPATYFYSLIPLFMVVYFIALYEKVINQPFLKIAYTFVGILYVALPFTLLHFIAFQNNTYHYELVLGISFLLWANDIGAYFFGSWLGKTPLFKRISPKKTWEGSLGGALLTLLVAYAVACYDGLWDLRTWLYTALIVTIAGTYGDLLESVFKRSLQIKDSSSWIPGHGGFLDRYDSFLLAIPLILGFLEIFGR
jgi:phosphatidate cytidylyltransferase